MTDNMAEGMFALDASGMLIYMNRAEHLLGWSEPELHDKAVHDVIQFKHEDGSAFPASQCPLHHAIRRGETIRIEDDAFVHRDGHMLAVAYSSSPMTLDGNRGSVVVFSDITNGSGRLSVPSPSRNTASWRRASMSCRRLPPHSAL